MPRHLRHLFIVRVWLEADDTSHAAQWRGSVEHTLSGQRLYFTNLEDLVDFITLRRGNLAAASPPPAPMPDQTHTSDH